MSESLSIVVSGESVVTAENVQNILSGDYLRMVTISLRNGTRIGPCCIHTIWPDCIETGTRDGSVHGVVTLADVQSIKRA